MQLCFLSRVGAVWLPCLDFNAREAQRRYRCFLTGIFRVEVSVGETSEMIGDAISQACPARFHPLVQFHGRQRRYGTLSLPDGSAHGFGKIPALMLELKSWGAIPRIARVASWACQRSTWTG